MEPKPGDKGFGQERKREQERMRENVGGRQKTGKSDEGSCKCSVDIHTQIAILHILSSVNCTEKWLNSNSKNVYMETRTTNKVTYALTLYPILPFHHYLLYPPHFLNSSFIIL